MKKRSLKEINPNELLNPSSDSSTEYSEAEALNKTFPNVALGIFKRQDGDKVRFVVAEIPYDPETGDVGFLKELNEDMAKEEIVNRFKIHAADKILENV